MLRDALVSGLSNRDLVSSASALLLDFLCCSSYNARESSMQAGLSKASCAAAASSSTKGGDLEYKPNFWGCKTHP